MWQILFFFSSRKVLPANGIVRMSDALTPGMTYPLKFEAHYMYKVSPAMYKTVTYSEYIATNQQAPLTS